MRAHWLLFPLGLSLLTATLATSRADGPDWFEFVLPWDDSTPGLIDVSALNPCPAGGRGFITARDGRFYDEKGNRVRFLGVNFCFSANFPAKADAVKVAARLRKFGVNIVRLHLMDYYHAPRGIFDARHKDKQHFDPDQLDRLDYLVAQLKRNGIYVNINLHVARAFTPADGVADAGRLPPLGSVVNYFDPRTIELHKKYARALLTHANPYTKKRYVEEPAVAVIELTNENTLVGMAWGDTLDRLPASYRAELGRQWNAWLKARYGSTGALRAAWKGGPTPAGTELLRNGTFATGTDTWRLEKHEGAGAVLQTPADLVAPKGVDGKALRVQVDRAGKQAWHIMLHQPGLDLREGEPYTITFWARADRKRALGVSVTLDQGDYRNLGLSDPVSLTTEWRPYRLQFRSAAAATNHGRLVFALGAESGWVDLAGVSVRPGTGETLPDGDLLAKGTIPLGKVFRSPAGEDWVAFLLDTERKYADTMRTYVKKDLGARANVTCSQVSYGGLGGALRERRSDYADMHGYWEHPHFPRRAWDPEDWRIANTPLTRNPEGGALVRLARHRLAGLPFTVSEYNHAAPSDYQAECLPMLAAFAALQDWDGIYLFDYNSDRETWKSNKIRGFFSIDSNPAKMAFFPAAAMLFLRGDLSPAAEECRLCVPEDGISTFMASRSQWLNEAWSVGKSSPLEAVSRKLSVAFVPGKGPVTVRRSGGKEAVSPVRWQGPGTDQALFTADSPRSKVMVGLMGGRKLELPGWRVEMAKTDTNFAALTLTAMDGRPIKESRSLLLTAVGRVENKGMAFRADRKSVGKGWGTGPTRAEGIPATVAIETQAKTAVVYALDGLGRRQRRLEATLSMGRLTFAIGPSARTLWYEVSGDAQGPVGN
jgi:hypothetical protein